MKRLWLFYKRTNEKTVEFRRMYDGETPNDHLPVSMQGTVIFQQRPTEKQIEVFVRKCGWVAEPPREHNHPIAQIILKGRW